MELWIWARTYDSFGGHHPFHPIEALVELPDIDFGTSLKSIDLTLCFASRRLFRTDPAVVRRFERYHEYLSRLPERKYSRKKSELKLSVRASFAAVDEVFPRTRADREALSRHFPHDWATEVLDLLASEVEECSAKFKKSDDFDLIGFASWLKGLRDQVPETQSQASALVAALREKRQLAREQLSEWEKLDVDWNKFHPSARELVPDVRLWSEMDEFAPNGNDTGADVLDLFMQRRSRMLAQRDEGRSFYEKIWRDWGFACPPLSATPDAHERDVHRELIIGLAFAHLKVFGECPDWLKTEAVSQIDQYSGLVEANHSDWHLKAECLTMQSIMKAVLLSVSGS